MKGPDNQDNNGKKKFNRANELRMNGDYSKAINLYEELLASNDFDPFEVLIQLAGAYFFSKQYNEAYQHYKLALHINSEEEIVSLGFYLTCAELNRLEEGLLEMKRYLDKYPPVLYKDTIDELVSSLNNGYATNFKDIILGFVK